MTGEEEGKQKLNGVGRTGYLKEGQQERERVHRAVIGVRVV